MFFMRLMIFLCSCIYYQIIMLCSCIDYQIIVSTAFIMFRASHCLRRTLSRWVRELQYSISWRKESRGNSVENSCRDCGQYVYWILTAETYPQQIGETVWKKVLLLNLRESLIDKNEVEWCSLYYPRERNPFDVSFLFKFRQLRNLCSKEGFVVWD